jgi:L-gulono-1,4-lactone dehydrogenase|eukprot:g5862.t1
MKRKGLLSRRLIAVVVLLACVGCVVDGVTWTDWDGLQVCHPSAFVQPKSELELVQIVRSAHANNHQVKVVGSGHSFSPITLTETPAAVLLNLDFLNGVLRIDPEASVVVVQSGIRVHVLNDRLLEAGFALINTGAIAQQSIAGATQTGTHGTGKNIGSMSTAIVGMKILLANGTFVNASRDENQDIFDAGRVGLGALGIVTETTLRIVPKFKLKRTAMPYSLKNLLNDLPRLYEQYERLQWYYTPYTDNATLLLREVVPNDTPIVPCWPGSLEEFSNLVHGQNKTCTDWSFKALCHEADDATKYTEMEYFVNVQDSEKLVDEFMEFQNSMKGSLGQQCNSKVQGPCALFTGLRYAARTENEPWMSPMYPGAIAVLSNIVLGSATKTGPSEIFDAYAKGLERIATKYGGRPHWGKMNWATAKDIAPVYQQLDSFKTLRKQLDPDGMFVNDYLKRILGV